MSRSVDEWSSDNDDAMPPPRARLRIFERSGGRCAVCTRKVGPGFEPFDFDHIMPLIAGGKNTESNFQVLCRNLCHKAKTAMDVAEKSKVAAIRKKHLGVKSSKGRPMAGTKASGWKRKMDGSVERR